MSAAENNIQVSEHLISAYKKCESDISKNSAAELNNRRAEALAAFAKTGVPAYNSEDYKYLNLESAFADDYISCTTPPGLTVNVEELFRCNIPELDTHLILLVNGFFYEKNNSELSRGIVVKSLCKAASEHKDLFEKYYNSHPKTSSHGLALLNTMFTADGVFIYVPKGAVFDKPIQVVNLLISEQQLMVNYHNLIIAEEGSNADIIVCDHTLSSLKALTNSVTEIVALPGSRISVNTIQNKHETNTHISNTYITQKQNSSVTFNTLTLNGGITRNNLVATLDGTHCECNVYGMYFADGAQHVDNFTFVDHAKPDCNSNQVFKGIIDHTASGAFTGRILVQQDAQKTNAYQLSKNILLKETAKMNIKPQLEIYADDVKCSHGAATGQLDQEALFYMRSRGIGYEEARMLLLQAFAFEITGKITTVALRERMEDMIEKRLRKELVQCDNCNSCCKK